MSIVTTWTIKFGGAIGSSTRTDITSRVLGMTINQPLNISAPSRHSAIITLENNNGDFTPDIGNSYSSVNWFAQAVFIDVDINSTYQYPVFDGIIESFELYDDGINSTVQLTVIDPLTFAGRSKIRSAFSAGFDYIETALYKSYLKVSLQDALPALDGTSYGFYSLELCNKPLPADPPKDTNVIVDLGLTENEVVADIVTSEVAPSAFCVFWPYQIRPLTSSYSIDLILIGPDMIRRNYYNTEYPQLDAHTFTFVEKTPGTSELPIKTLKVGYNVTELINEADVRTKETGTTSTAVNQTSIDAVGIRSVQYSGTILESDAQAQNRANMLASRFGEVRFVPNEISLSASQVDAVADSSAAQEWALLLDAGGGMWQQAYLEYTPTGASSQKTEHVVLAGRTLRVTPSDTILTLKLLPAVDYQTFVLDSNDRGVLNTNRLG